MNRWKPQCALARRTTTVVALASAAMICLVLPARTMAATVAAAIDLDGSWQSAAAGEEEELLDLPNDHEVEHDDPNHQDLYQACRRHPMWRSSSSSDSEEEEVHITYDACAQVTGAVHWLAPTQDDEWVLVNEGDQDAQHQHDSVEKWQQWWKRHDKDVQMKQCLQQQQQHQSDTTMTSVCSDDVPPTQPQAVSIYSHIHEGDLVIVQDVWTECEAAWLQALVDCMQKLLPHSMPFYQERPFGTNYNDNDDADDKDEDNNKDETNDKEQEEEEEVGLYTEKGGNHVHFLAGLLQRYLPGLVVSIYTGMTLAYEYAAWGQPETFASDLKMFTGGPGFPPPTQLGLRTAEYLQYHTTGRLGQHADAESIFTISVALSDPDEYQGGHFQLLSNAVQVKVPRLSGVVFFSEASHGITPITAGERRVFVTELWEYASVPLGSSRPSVAQFLERQEEQERQQQQHEAGAEQQQQA
ncbi:hypothetical protein ACA910_017337 [Epithemia clementina (nom. ined.)]